MGLQALGRLKDLINSRTEYLKKNEFMQNAANMNQFLQTIFMIMTYNSDDPEVLKLTNVSASEESRHYYPEQKKKDTESFKNGVEIYR